MRKAFLGYLRPEESDFAELWRRATFVIDANVLLNAYGYSAETRADLLAMLGKLSGRLWIPHQFALEYMRNRVEVVLKQAKNVARVHQELYRIVEHDFRSQKSQPFVSEEIIESIEKLCEQLKQGEKDQEGLLLSDPFLDRVLGLFENNVGPEYPNATLDKLFDTAKDRFARRIPPGYADEKKPVPERFGDFVGWQQILEYGKTKKSGVLLVTDDAKEDWWHIREKRTLGPRPELISEFTRVCGTNFYMYSTGSFMEYAQKYFEVTIGVKTLKELHDARELQLAAREPEKPDATESDELKKPALPTSEPEPQKGLAPAPGMDLKQTNTGGK
jgi:PIN like domain